MMPRVLMIAFAVLFSISLVTAAADFSVNTFSCTPSEVAINEVFSCTAQIRNVGDAAGSVNEVRLYPDSGEWLEETNYLQSSGTSVSPGQTTEVTFSGMRATKSGNNGFSRITLDNQADTWPADNNVKENVIDVSVRVTNSVSSRASGETFTATPEITAGGNIDVTLTFTVNSGGCSIGSQSASKSTTGLLDQQTWTPSAWTVTEGSTGDCKYTLTTTATGANGVATTLTSASSTVTCSSSDCATSSGGSSGGGGAGGGGGGTPTLGELKSAVLYELSADSSVKFSFGNVNHTFTVLSLTETTAKVTIKSEPQTLTFIVGEEKSIDFEGDGKKDISIKLKSINIITKKANFIFTPLYAPASVAGTGKAVDTPAPDQGSSSGSVDSQDTGPGTAVGKREEISGGFSVLKVIGILVLLGLIALVGYHIWNSTQQRRLARAVRLRHFTPERLNLGKSDKHSRKYH